MSERITMGMSIENMIKALVDGNPGATSACVKILTHTEDSDALDLLRLDAAGIYGPNIWIAYKDICGQDVAKMQIMLRSGELETALKANPEFQYYKERENVG